MSSELVNNTKALLREMKSLVSGALDEIIVREFHYCSDDDSDKFLELYITGKLIGMFAGPSLHDQMIKLAIQGGAIMDEYKSIADTINDECIEFLEITYNNKVSAERFSEMSTDELDSMPDLDELVRQDAERLANIPYLMEIAKQPDKGVVDTLNDILKPDERARREAQKLNQEIHNADY